METLKNWRLLITGYRDGWTNMAIDEAILRAYAEGAAPPTFRIYGWQPEAFSLGYFQDPSQQLNLDECKKRSVGFVRRITGGSIVFHSQELTYSIVCSGQHFGCGSSVEDSFKRICSFIIRTYQGLGLKSGFALDQSGIKRALGRKTAFCSSGQEKYDILINAKKIGGNAQRRFRRIIFQQGFIPLKADLDFAILFLREKPLNLKNKVTFLNQALGRPIAFEELAFRLIENFKQANCLELVKRDLSDEEKNLAEYLKREKYSRPEWNIFRQDLSRINKWKLS
jgi:lipoate-protein ligase A